MEMLSAYHIVSYKRKYCKHYCFLRSVVCCLFPQSGFMTYPSPIKYSHTFAAFTTPITMMCSPLFVAFPLILIVDCFTATTIVCILRIISLVNGFFNIWILYTQIDSYKSHVNSTLYVRSAHFRRCKSSKKPNCFLPRTKNAIRISSVYINRACVLCVYS